MTDELAWLDLTEQRMLLEGREVTARQLVEAAIDRIESLDPGINAVIHRQFDEALDRPGIPFLLKDVLTTEAGQPYHCGLRAAKADGHRATVDSELVRRYRAAGLTFLGRTNTPELACSITTEPLAYGPTRNPWDRERTPAGSSGGSAAAVAAGMVAAASGNDMGGSIRAPASNCGLVGLKPSRGRTTIAPCFGEFWGPLTHQHALTRTVRDSAWLLDISAGPAPGDPYWAPPPVRPWLDEVGADPGPLRIGWRTRIPGGAEPHPEVRAAVASAARLLEGLGHRVDEATVEALDQTGMVDAVALLFATVVARDVQRWSEVLGRDITPELEPDTRLMLAAGNTVTGPDHFAHMEVLQAWSRDMARIWQDMDVLLVPVLPQPPLPLGQTDVDAASRLVAFTTPFNITGEPAISLPLHGTPDGLPVGVQFVAPMGREDVLFRLASQLEEAAPWSTLRPPGT